MRRSETTARRTWRGSGEGEGEGESEGEGEDGGACEGARAERLVARARVSRPH